MADPVRVFYSYSHEDEPMLGSLRTHLAMLRRRGLITEWVDRDIEAGSGWRDRIAQELEAADLVLLLVSADFVNSDFCYEQEMPRALERSDEGAAKVVAIVLRPVDGWEDSPFARLQVAPKDAQPVTTWQNQDEALADVAAKIRRVVERIREERAPTATPPQIDYGSHPLLAERQRQLESALDELSAAGDDAFLVADLGEYYAQFRVDDGLIWCEVVSNANLPPELALDEGQESMLSSLGWNPPEENLPNWWWPAPPGSTSKEIAAFAVQTLSDAYRLEFASPFEFVVSWV
jgi:hypothetical protein